MKTQHNQIQLDNPNNPELVSRSLPSDEEMAKALEDILDDCENTVGYEDNSHIMPINAVSVSQAVPRIITYIKTMALGGQ